MEMVLRADSGVRLRSADRGTDPAPLVFEGARAGRRSQVAVGDDRQHLVTVLARRQAASVTVRDLPAAANRPTPRLGRP